MTTSQSTRRALLVMGMHRSGTSAATRVVNLLGADLGNDLVQPGPDNPDGFWEHAEAVRINEALLEGLGRTWYDMREMPSDWQDTDAAGEALARIESLVRRDFQTAPLCAIKDPRLCLTAPIWIKALQGMGFEVGCLFVVRDPREVVSSLHIRNHWAREPLFLMWVQYLLGAEAASRQLGRTLIMFDQLLEDWRGTMERVAGDLGVAWPVAPDSVANEVRAFLNPGRRNHTAAAANAYAVGEAAIPGIATLLFNSCVELSRGKGKWSSIAQWQSAYRSFAELYASRLDELLSLRWQAEEGIQRARRDRDEIEAKAEEVLHELRAEIASRDAEIASRNAEIARRDVEIASRDAEIASRDAEIASREAEIAKRDSRIKDIESSTSWRITAPLRWLKQRML